jgi:(p)ppGpp synthase/HD superfamily hydrolase
MNATRLDNYNAARLQLAIQLAASLHRTQRRRVSNEPYIVHPLRVMLALSDRPVNTRIAAVLHDTVEDCGLSLAGVEADFGPEVRRLVDAMTKRDGEIFTDRIDRCIEEGGEEAVRIKIADMEDNLADHPKPSMFLRYQDSLAVLRAALRRTLGE